MSLDSEITFPTQTHTQKKCLTAGLSAETYRVQSSEEEKDGENAEAQSVQLATKKLSLMGTSYIYVSSERKPRLLIQLESYLNKELQTISFHQPKFQELKLQVYRNIFGSLIKEFKTYQSLLSAIKKEYENTLECQQDQIQKLEPLQSRLRLVTEECDRKIQARLEEEQAVIGALKQENQQLKKDLEAMRAKEKAMQRVVDQLQAEVSNQYLQYREERDARKLLMWQLNDLTGDSVKKEDPAEINTEENKDLLELQLTLKMCQKDLTKAQEELVKMKIEHWDTVPRYKWDTLTQTHTQILLQLQTLQDDFDQLKNEYDTLLELHRRGKIKNGVQDPISVQVGTGEGEPTEYNEENRQADGLNY